MKSIIKFLFAILIPVICTWYASTKGIPALTIGVLVITLGAVIFVFRASLLMLAGTNVYRNNPQSGIRLMTAAYKTRKLNPSYQLIYAYIILRHGQLEESEAIMNKATVIGKHALNEKEFKEVEFNRALITWKRGDLSQAIVQLEELFANGYSSAALYGSLGSFYLLNKEYDKTIELSKKGIEEHANDLVNLDNLGQAYIGLGMLDEALEIYKNLIPQKPEFMEAYYNYATILEKRDKLSEAKYYYETALTYDEKFLSTITHDEICKAIERVQNISIENVDIENIVYEGVAEPIEFDASKELSDIETVNIDVSMPNSIEENSSTDTEE